MAREVLQPLYVDIRKAEKPLRFFQGSTLRQYHLEAVSTNC